MKPAAANLNFNGKYASSMNEFWVIVTHPAMRLGFLDARRGALHDCEDIVGRIVRETPPNGLKLWRRELVRKGAVEAAQRRYEEGRQLWVDYRLVVRGWSDCRYPPKSLVDLVTKLILERSAG